VHFCEGTFKRLGDLGLDGTPRVLSALTRHSNDNSSLLVAAGILQKAFINLHIAL
jgi:hypothetical protein